jgi:hypothetical protein
MSVPPEANDRVLASPLVGAISSTPEYRCDGVDGPINGAAS